MITNYKTWCWMITLSREHDGLHMRGPTGRSFLTRSFQKVLMKAKLIEKSTDLYMPDGWKHERHSLKSGKPGQENIPPGRKSSVSYNAMGRMINRIRSVSTATWKENNTIAEDNDEVFSIPGVRKQYSNRASVITTTRKEDFKLQQHYNIPVQNSFSNLLN